MSQSSSSRPFAVCVQPAAAEFKTPGWAVAAPLNAWIEIPGTAGAGGSNIESYSGWAPLPDGRIVSTLNGGHGDGTRNSTVIINLLSDAPRWSEIGPPSPTNTYETAYREDGKPNTSHIYHSTMWVPTTNRVMRIGCKYVNGGGNTSFKTVDGFDLSTNRWDPAGTYPNLTSSDTGVGYHPILNQVLTVGSFFNPLTGAHTPITNNGNVPSLVRFPYSWDSTRKQFFGVQVGDGQRYSLSLGLVAVKIVGPVATAITIADSPAKTMFLNDLPEYAGMAYDPVNDQFLFYWGASEETRGRIFIIKPNNTTTWDMTLFNYQSGGVLPVAAAASGINSKFTYVPQLKGIVTLLSAKSNLYFMRTS